MTFDKRLGASLDLTSGRICCASCGLDVVDLVQIVGLPGPVHPEMVAVSMVCRTCGSEQAVTLEQQDGAVILGTALPRS